VVCGLLAELAQSRGNDGRSGFRGRPFQRASLGGQTRAFVRKLNASAQAAVIEAEPTLQISVDDEGYGISSGELPYVFDLFAQCGARSPSTGAGLGIGLALVKYLVEAHGGTVAVASGDSRIGTTVTIRLPVAREGFGPHIENA
jgi:signal transduction histidine kinase